MRICLLTDQELDHPDGLPGDDWPCDPRPFRPDDDWTLLTLEKERCVAQVLRAGEAGFDLFFNLCDGAWDEPRPGIEVVQTLERLRVPFTGAASDFYEPTREAMKRVCRAWGLDTPAGVEIRGMRDLERALDTLRFPVIVKHPSSYASTGLTPRSVARNALELRIQVARMRALAGSALAEEFIAGDEATVLVCDNAAEPRSPLTFTPLRYRFPPGESFKHEALKWVDYDGLTAAPVDDEELDARLRGASAAFFRGMNGTGWARTDIRIAADGRIVLLEINPNCGIYYPASDAGSADLVLLADPAGHAGFTDALIDAALARHAGAQRGWCVEWHPKQGYGLRATRSFAPGEVVVRFEGTPHTLVSRSHVEARWAEPHRTWFAHYAWPLTEEIWVTWSDDPEAWRPVNHGCEPTTWLQGLDLVARTTLSPGDEITLDYGTLYDETMPAFDCTCDVAGCRGRITGRDWRLDLMDRYGDHLSDHIARKRRAVGTPASGK